MRVSYVSEDVGRLDQVLLSLIDQDDAIPSISRSQIKKLIDGGGVSVNEVVATKAGRQVEPGDEIDCLLSSDTDNSLEPYDFPLEVVHEEVEFLVLNKPPGISVHPGIGTGNKTLLNALIGNDFVQAREFPLSDRPGIVHRLDHDTTGLIVVARTQQALTSLSEQFQERTVEKHYRALALSKPRGGLPFDKSDTGVIDAPIGRHPTKRTLMALNEKGRDAKTEWRVIERFRHAVLLDIHLHTGRTHQIRVHLESIGSGVLGDQSYGHFDTLSDELSRDAKTFGRQALHASHLVFDHPKTGKRCSYEASIPEDLVDLMNTFRGA